MHQETARERDGWRYKGFRGRFLSFVVRGRCGWAREQDRSYGRWADPMYYRLQQCIPVRGSVPESGTPSPIGTTFEFSGDQGTVGKVMTIPTQQAVDSVRTASPCVTRRMGSGPNGPSSWQTFHSGSRAAASPLAIGKRTEHHTCMHSTLAQHVHASRPVCACFWPSLMCAHHILLLSILHTSGRGA